MKIEEIARETGFCKRKRKLSPIQFLRTLLYKDFDSNRQSLNDHVVNLTLEDDIAIRKQSLYERFNKASVEFIKQVLIDQFHSFNTPPLVQASACTQNITSVPAFPCARLKQTSPSQKILHKRQSPRRLPSEAL